jgi:multidrug resistance efflux pump
MNQVANTVILPVEEYESLRAQVLSLTKERDLLLEKGAATFRLDMAELRKQLAASQAREAKLREALDALKAAWPHTNGYAPIKLPPYAEMLALFAMVNEALALPTDTTALDERLAQEKATSPGDSFL